jgi:acyl carrier protein
MAHLSPVVLHVFRKTDRGWFPAMAIRSIIINEIRQIAREHATKLVPINDDLALHESGLDSLAIAVLVARLEDQLGANPFMRSADVALPVTIGEFIKLYEDDLQEARPLLQLALMHD